MSFVLHTALCLALQTSGGAAMQVDWSTAVGADSAIADVRREYVRVVNSGEGLPESFFTNDALAARGAGPLLAGAAALAAPSRAMSMDGAHITLTLMPRRYAITGDKGAETGTFVETVSDGQRVESVEGLYVTIYSRSPDGRWKIAMDVRATGSRAPIAVW
jgi:ketosteroid isomerase-like protein